MKAYLWPTTFEIDVSNTSLYTQQTGEEEDEGEELERVWLHGWHKVLEAGIDLKEELSNVCVENRCPK